jgi:LemA protein
VWAVVIYNRLVRLRNQARTAWADIDVQLTRRHDLVPQLVAAVQGYVGHEKAVLEAVTELRARALVEKSPARLGEVESARQNLRLLAEDDGTSDVRGVQEDLEATVRLARMDLTELQGLPLPSQ